MQAHILWLVLDLDMSDILLNNGPWGRGWKEGLQVSDVLNEYDQVSGSGKEDNIELAKISR